MKALLIILFPLVAYAGSLKLDVSCHDLDDMARFLDMGLERSQELYHLNDPERYVEDRKTHKELKKKVTDLRDRECDR